MTDGPDGSGQIPRRAPRVSDGGAPVSGALAIVLAVIAVVAGFLILRAISDGGDDPLDVAAGQSESSDEPADGVEAGEGSDADGTTPTLAPSTTLPTLVKTGASVIVANANGIGGSASLMSRALDTDGFTTVDPVNSTTGDLEESAIFFDASLPAAEVVANSLSSVLGGVGTIAAMPDPPPTSGGVLNDATVLLILGNDKADKTLAELAPDLVAESVVAAVTNPPIAGTTTTTTTG